MVLDKHISSHFKAVFFVYALSSTFIVLIASIVWMKLGPTAGLSIIPVAAIIITISLGHWNIRELVENTWENRSLIAKLPQFKRHLIEATNEAEESVNALQHEREVFLDAKKKFEDLGVHFTSWDCPDFANGIAALQSPEECQEGCIEIKNRGLLVVEKVQEIRICTDRINELVSRSDDAMENAINQLARLNKDLIEADSRPIGMQGVRR